MKIILARGILISIISISLLIPVILRAQTKSADPWEWDNIVYTDGKKTDNSEIAYSGGDPVTVFFLGGIRFYQKTLSNKRMYKCPNYPSCSRFGYESISRFGLWGVLMTVDRLFYRENNSQYYYYRLIELEDGFRFYDPPDNNYIFDKSKWSLQKSNF